jgi:hypothetical protein
MIEAKAFRTFIRIFCLFKSERLSANIKLTLHEALGVSGRHLPLKIAAPAKQGSAHRRKFLKVYIGPRFAHGFQPSVCIRLYNKIVQTTSRSHTKS